MEGTARKRNSISMETQVQVIEKLDQSEKMVGFTYFHEFFNKWHNSKEPGQHCGTCEVCCADEVKNDRQRVISNRGETSQCVDAGSVSAYTCVSISLNTLPLSDL